MKNEKHINIPANLVSIILSKQISSKSTWIIEISKEEKMLNYSTKDGSTGVINLYQFFRLCTDFMLSKGYGICITENERGSGLTLSKGGLIQKSFSFGNMDNFLIEATLWVIQNNKIKSNKKEIA